MSEGCATAWRGWCSCEVRILAERRRLPVAVRVERGVGWRTGEEACGWSGNWAIRGPAEAIHEFWEAREKYCGRWATGKGQYGGTEQRGAAHVNRDVERGRRKEGRRDS